MGLEVSLVINLGIDYSFTNKLDYSLAFHNYLTYLDLNNAPSLSQSEIGVLAAYVHKLIFLK